MSKMTLPTDSAARKEYPLYRGCLRYFPAALAGVARTSKLGNDKHNPGEEMHHARGKSSDHADCVIRHLMDVEDLMARSLRGQDVESEEILLEVNQFAWRALAFSQEIHELLCSAPVAPGAKDPEKDEEYHSGPSSILTCTAGTCNICDEYEINDRPESASSKAAKARCP